MRRLANLRQQRAGGDRNLRRHGFMSARMFVRLLLLPPNPMPGNDRWVLLVPRWARFQLRPMVHRSVQDMRPIWDDRLCRVSRRFTCELCCGDGSVRRSRGICRRKLRQRGGMRWDSRAGRYTRRRRTDHVRGRAGWLRKSLRLSIIRLSRPCRVVL